jgi:hypothetical protein
MKRSHLAAVVCLVGLGIGSHAAAQDERRAARVLTQTIGGSVETFTLDDRVIANVPFAADATTTVTQTLGDGTKIEQRTNAKIYRDSTGRIRREQTVIGLDRLNPAAAPQTTIAFDTIPGDPMPYTLNPATKTARRAQRGVQWLTTAVGLNVGYTFRQPGTAPGIANIPVLDSSFTVSNRTRSGTQGAAVPPDIKPTEESLGTRQIEGVKATGRRQTTVIPAGRIGNDRAIQIVEEQWDSPELNMVISSRFSDPRTGVVEYRMTNISRSEPRADLFIVPSDYTVIESNGGARGGRAGGGGEPAQPGQGGRQGGRGGRGN